MLRDDERHLPVRVRCGGRKKFADGGLASAASEVAGAGRNGDDIVVHVNRREFEEMRGRWGDPTVNPETGLPEFFLGDLWDGAKDLWDDAKDYVVPIGAAAAGAFLPGIGQAVGGFLPGAASLLGSTGLQALSTGLLGAGAGALLGGGKGALLGGLGGVAGAYGGDFLQGDLDGGSLGSALSSGLGAIGGGAGAAGAGAGMGSGALLPAITMAALNLAGGLGGGAEDGAAKDAAKAADKANDQFNEPLPKWENPRKRRRYAYGDVPDYTAQGEREYFDDNGFADGGRVKDKSRVGDYDPGVSMDLMLSETGISPLSWIGYMMGLQQAEPEVADGKGDREGYAGGGYIDTGSPSHGRADDIEAVLSEGEYVIDAETVALLGNGSTEAGAAQLDRLRENIRKHKGSALAHGQISPDALPAENYI